MYYCPICGSNNAEGKRFCAACGAPLRGAERERGRDARRRSAESGREIDAHRRKTEEYGRERDTHCRSAETDGGRDVRSRNAEDCGRDREPDSRESGTWAPPTPPLYSAAAARSGRGGGMEERHIWKIYLLTLVTFGFYRYYVCHKMAQDINLVCRGDGKHTTEGGKIFLFSLLSFGIYDYYWYYQLMKRLRNYAAGKDIPLRAFCGMKPENGWLLLKAGGLLLVLFLSVLGCIPSVYADYLLYDNINAVAREFNAEVYGAGAPACGMA